MSAEEKAYWQAIVKDLQHVLTIAAIAERVLVDDRQVWRWKAGERVPRGREATRLYMLHVELCPERQCQNGHSQQAMKA